MRIEILPCGGSAAPADAGADAPPVSCPQLARLSPSGQLVLIELQGALEMDGADPRGGQTVGTLKFPPGRENRPVLQISYHRLEGRLVKLTRPIAVLEKRVQAGAGAEDPDEALDESLRADEAPSSPPPVPAGDAPSSPPATPQPRKRARQDAAARGSPAALSSSPMPERAPRFSDGHLDFSSPNPRFAAKHERPPAVAYQVVTMIREKLLFSERPEPISKID